MKKARILLACILCAALLFAPSCDTVNVAAADLMSGVKSGNADGKEADQKFKEAAADFYIELFKHTIDSNKSSLISPLSVMLALSMTANGADGETLLQMEAALGEDIKIDELNRYLYSYIKGLPNEGKAKLSVANSIWFRDGLDVGKTFLHTNADFYGADIYQGAFDDKLCGDINNWVKAKTDGMIDKLLDSISRDTVMYLINAVAFDAEWQNIYETKNIRAGEFTNIRNEKESVEFMSSGEGLYIDDGRATGFIKPYAGGKYSFAALLPNEDITLNEYIASMSGGDFLNAVGGAKSEPVSARMPKFTYSYQIRMNDALIALGMQNAFDGNADFGRITDDVFISEVLHKTFISVDERGTKAGAVTKVEMTKRSAAMGKYLNLDRPFLYAIIENSTGLPVFIGTVTGLK